MRPDPRSRVVHAVKPHPDKCPHHNARSREPSKCHGSPKFRPPPLAAGRSPGSPILQCVDGGVASQHDGAHAAVP
eukprot:598231-Prymnesium_polylepis.1